MELKPNIFNHIYQNIPDFELSYETISHKKVSNEYNVCLAIPPGKKFIAWFTYYNQSDVCYIFELNKDKVPSKCFFFKHDFIHFSHGSLFYGSIFNEDDNPISYYIIEDIFFYQGLDLKNYNVYNKLIIIIELPK